MLSTVPCSDTVSNRLHLWMRSTQTAKECLFKWFLHNDSLAAQRFVQIRIMILLDVHWTTFVDWFAKQERLLFARKLNFIVILSTVHCLHSILSNQLANVRMKEEKSHFIICLALNVVKQFWLSCSEETNQLRLFVGNFLAGIINERTIFQRWNHGIGNYLLIARIFAQIKWKTF